MRIYTCNLFTHYHINLAESFYNALSNVYIGLSNNIYLFNYTILYYISLNGYLFNKIIRFCTYKLLIYDRINITKPVHILLGNTGSSCYASMSFPFPVIGNVHVGHRPCCTMFIDISHFAWWIWSPSGSKTCATRESTSLMKSKITRERWNPIPPHPQ